MEAKRLAELFAADQSKDEIVFTGQCHQCKRPVTVTIREIPDGFQVEGGAVYEPEAGSGKFWLKCDRCFEIGPVLTEFQPCEVYSRVVGYLRPISQWNGGKQAEFALRKTFDKAVGV